jgi:hypothetical protein
MEEAAKETVIIVHGTWAALEPAKRRWYEPVNGRPGSDSFSAKLDASLGERGSPARCWAHCSEGNPIFHWSGDNSWIARTHAASALADYLTKLRNEGWRYHIVAHSHGGNVLLEALPQISPALGSRKELQGKLVTLGSPFMDTMSTITDKVEWRDKNLIATLLILAAFISSAFVYFAIQSTQIVKHRYCLPLAAYSTKRGKSFTP